MPRELIVAALIGALGALCLAAGIMGYLGSGNVFHPRLADPDVALGVGFVGVVLLMLETRLMIPILKTLAKDRTPH
jgi:hypothetical protein